MYWRPMYNQFKPSGSYREAHFPAQFLRAVLANVVAGYKAKLKSTGLLPVSLWVRVCDPLKETKHLDESTIEKPRDLTLSV